MPHALCSLVLLPLLVAASASPAVAGGVRIVEPTGTQSFATIAAAVAAAGEGDVLLVGEGTYAGFTIASKSLSVFAVPGATVTVTTPVTVTAIDATQSVVLSGLRVDPPSAYGVPALSILDCAGDVRIERCTLEAKDLSSFFCPGPLLPGAPGIRIASSTRVALQACTSKGGRGESLDGTEDASCTPGAVGGAGIAAESSVVALYEVVSTGGAGGGSEGTEGTGGAGLALLSSAVLASNGQFTGGIGGESFLPFPVQGGPGGSAVTFVASTLHEVACSFAPGLGGFGPGGPGPTGATFAGGTPSALAGPARRMTLTPSVQGDQSFWSVSMSGLPNELMLLLASLEPGFALAPVAHGAWLVRRSMLASVELLGATGATGAGVAARPTGDLPAGSLYERRYVQLAVRSSGSIWLGSQASLLLLDRESGPDCDGNGVNDLVDVVTGTAPDANDNLIPDACPGG